MPITPDSSFPRRKFLKGALGAIGTSLVGFSPAAALAKLAPSKVLTIAYWDGSHFVSAKRLTSGDSTLTTVQMTLRGYNCEGGPIRAIDAYFVVSTAKGVFHAPFTAWVAPPAGNQGARYTHPVDPTQGVILKLHLSDATGSTLSTTNLIGGAGVGAKLRVGQYVLVDGEWDMNQFTFDPADKLAPLSRILGAGPIPQYVTLHVDRA